MGERERIEEQLVREAGESIGYGRTMQLCEKLWREMLAARRIPVGAAFTVGPCAGCLVPCQCVEEREPELDDNGHCDWCAGSRRVTERVRKVQREAAG